MLVFSGAFFVGLLLAGLLWNHITLPYANSENIAGPLSVIGFNPLNNQLRFVVFIFLPTIVLLALGFFCRRFFQFPEANFFKYPSKEHPRPDRRAIGLAVAGSGALALGLFLQFFSQSFAPSHLDFFHEGETLAPAISWLTGKGAWSGSFIVHGAFFDIFRTVLGWFVLDSVSIGSSRVAWSFLDHCTPVLMISLIVSCYLLLEKVEDSGAALLFLVLMLGTYRILLNDGIFFDKMHKIIPYIVGMIFLLRAMARRSRWSWFATGVMAPVAFFYSIDVGAFFFALTVLAILFAICTEATDHSSLSPNRARYARYTFLFWLVLGWVQGCLAITLVMGREEIVRMVETTFYWFRYKDFLDSYVYPHPFYYNRSHWLIYLMPLALCALYLFASVVLHRYLLIPEHRYISCIWLLFGASSILFSRYVIGRSDWNHVCRGSLFILLTLPLLIWIVLQHIKLVTEIERTRAFKWIAIVIVLVLGIEKLFLVGVNIRSVLDSSKSISRLVRLNDTAYLGKDEIKIYETLQKLKRGDEWLYVHTSEPAWYYLLRWPPETRFFVPWYASAESLQKELISTMEKHPPQYILYMSPSPPIDGISNQDRFPRVERWIAEEYVDHIIHDGWLIKVRRPKSLR
jgi:hypothetical protein